MTNKEKYKRLVDAEIDVFYFSLGQYPLADTFMKTLSRDGRLARHTVDMVMSDGADIRTDLKDNAIWYTFFATDSNEVMDQVIISTDILDLDKLRLVFKRYLEWVEDGYVDVEMQRRERQRLTQLRESIKKEKGLLVEEEGD